MREDLLSTIEQKRLDINALKPVPLELWGPYLSDRQWGTVREDYSANGDAWNYFTHDHARSRAYRWGEDGIAGISDYTQKICFAIALWNHKDPIIKERLFGLTNNEGNHGEDVKELYYFLDNSPTHSYMRMLYKYPHASYPYEQLIKENAARGKHDPEYEILDTGIFDDGNYFDVYTEYAKRNSTDIVIKITIINRGNDEAKLTVMPTLWFSNYWSAYPNWEKPVITLSNSGTGEPFVVTTHPSIVNYHLYFQDADQLMFTENETNQYRVFGIPNPTPFVKDAFHEVIVHDNHDLLAGRAHGTKFAPAYKMTLRGGEQKEIFLRLSEQPTDNNPLAGSEDIISDRRKETEAFFKCIAPKKNDPELIRIIHQAMAGLLWSKKFYHIDIDLWLRGDPGFPPPPPQRWNGRNANWDFLNNQDILLMPDSWEYPWYAAWDLAFHCIPMAFIDPVFGKQQMIIMMREWYMNPEGQLPAYEWNFSDVNPPVHAWACLNIYRIEKSVHGRSDVDFLKKVFQKLLINFTWWVNRKDNNGNNLFEGGFLGLDNIGIINRSDMPPGYSMEQVDGTSWMAMYALNMMEIALEIAKHDETFEDVATKFYEHFVLISASLNEAHLWDKEDEFFYDVVINPDDSWNRIKVRSMVGLSVLFAATIIKSDTRAKLKDFDRRTTWFKNYRKSRGKYLPNEEQKHNNDILLSLVSKDKLLKILQCMLDENEFLSPGGIRSLSKYHEKNPLAYQLDGQQLHIQYDPADSTSNMFGGNSNWRGPVWMPVNYLLIKSLRKYHQFYGDEVKLECPTGSGIMMNLAEVADEIVKRLINIFNVDENGKRPVHGRSPFYDRPENKDLILFYEYFHGESSRGLGASHQTGWTSLIAELINDDVWEWET
jgi:hypothetical protein